MPHLKQAQTPPLRVKEKTLEANPSKKKESMREKFMLSDGLEIGHDLKEMAALGKIMKMESVLDETYEWKTYRDICEEYLDQLEK